MRRVMLVLLIVFAVSATASAALILTNGDLSTTFTPQTITSGDGNGNGAEPVMFDQFVVQNGGSRRFGWSNVSDPKYQAIVHEQTVTSDRNRGFYYAFDDNAETTGEVPLSFTFVNETDFSVDVGVGFFGWNDGDTVQMDLGSNITVAESIPNTTGHQIGMTALGDVDYFTSAAPETIEYSQTFDLGTTAYDNIAFVVFTRSTQNTAFTIAGGTGSTFYFNDFVLGGLDTESAIAPRPGDSQTDVPRDGVVLEWSAGEFAVSHDVYFGESLEDVNAATIDSPEFKGNQIETTHALNQRLEFSKTYYWRIDEVNAPPDNTIFKGNIWSFTVEPIAYPIVDVNATASSSNSAGEGPENTINSSGLDADDLHSEESKTMWLSSTIGPQPAWIQYELDRIYKLHEMLVWNHNSSVEPVIGFGVKEATIEYSTDGANWTTLGTHEFARSSGTAGYESNTTVDLSGVVAKYVKITANSNWGGFVPQFGLSEVRFFYIPVWAREPNPDSGSTDMDVDNVTLSWRAGREAASHEVYVSDSNQAVIDGTAPVATVSETSYDTGELELAQSYYWKIVEVNEAEAPTTWEGDVLNFTTREFLVVDDFEDYNNSSPHRVFQRWIDGIGYSADEFFPVDNPGNGSGAALGHDIWSYDSPHYDGDIMETAIVHGGAQSAPLYYDNSIAPFTSEIVRTFDVPQDWTKHGIKTLSLCFYGDPNNVAQQMYVKLNNSKVVYEGNAINNIARPAWQLWPIDLATVSGLQNVTSLTIGVEGASAAGMLYIDDIRLHPETFASISVDVTTPGDTVIGVPNDDDWPTGEAPEYVIDDASSTKYLHFKGDIGPSGFQVTPSVGAKVVTGLTFTTANDRAERDPIAYELSGSNAGIDGPYTVIAAGDIVDFSQATEWPRFTANETQIEFDNTVAYAHYQLIFTAVRDASVANSMQIAEVELLTTIPTP